MPLADSNPQGWRYVLLQQPGAEPGSDEARVSTEHVLQWVGRHVCVIRTSRQEANDQVPDVHVGRPAASQQRLGGICELAVAPLDDLRVAT